MKDLSIVERIVGFNSLQTSLTKMEKLRKNGTRKSVKDMVKKKHNLKKKNKNPKNLISGDEDIEIVSSFVVENDFKITVKDKNTVLFQGKLSDWVESQEETIESLESMLMQLYSVAYFLYNDNISKNGMVVGNILIQKTSKRILNYVTGNRVTSLETDWLISSVT
jgi:hypothetical protein